MAKNWRDLMDDFATHREQVTLLRTGSDGGRVEITFGSEGLTWHDMLERYMDFLSALSYVISEEDRERILDN